MTISNPNYLLKVPLPKTIKLGLECQHMNWGVGEQKHLVHDTSLDFIVYAFY